VVDDEDYEKVKHISWWYGEFNGVGRAYAVVNKKTIYLSREILQVAPGLVVDHINHDALDNRRENLRVCTQAQNLANRRTWRKGRLMGTKFSKTRKTLPWSARITFAGKYHNLGNFSSEIEAHDAYCVAAKKLHGEFACTK